jgi:tape measure domain-containing protein
MAKTVGDLLIKLGVDGIEGVTQLKSALTGLSKAAGPADAGLIKLGKAIKAFNRDGSASRDVIAGKLSALKSLRNQAGLNGAAFRALTKDIVDYQQKLAAADKQIDETTRKVSTLAQVSSQIPGRKAGTFGSQIAAFNEELKELSVTSDRYATVLRNIQERTRSFQRAQARQGVIAAGRTGAEGPADPRTAFQVTTELPRTTAALSLRLTELREDFANIAIGSKDYVNALREINSLESQIGDPFGTAARKQQIRGRLGQQEQFGMFAPRDPVQSAIARRERKRSRRYGGFAGGGMADQPAEATGLFRTIASIGSTEAKAATEMMGRSLSQVTAEINRQAAASNGSINSLQAQRTAFAQLRAGLDPTSQDFRELGVQIEKVDRRLEKLNKRRRRPTFGGVAQGLGGIAAGGVFGGPEGAIGAAVGGAVGGVAGVAAGAAIGAQAKMMREALGATSEYAAQLQKLEIALEGVAGPEYTDALKAANQVTKDFNVPIAVSTKGITRLSAAIIGAGGNVDDAEVVFRNITSAIKATGGGAQDVESAITAMVQTFSKGKVSAEELSGQLGERLPGAVTKFAEANNMTLPELQKSLKAGTVGLDQLMKFIISLGPEYEETARAIADSSADAGARATVAFEQVRREVGEALQPIGAQLQKAFGKFIIDILPAIKAGAVAAANGLNVLLDVSSFLIANFKELLIVAGAAGVALALQNLIGIATALGTALGKATVAMKGFTAASLLNPWVALAAGITAATVALVKHSKKNAEFNKSVIAGETTNEEANDRLREMNDKVQELEDRLGKETNNRMIRALTRQLKAAKIAAGDLELAMKLASSYEVAGIKYDRMTGRAINAQMSYTPTDFADPEADPTTKGATPMGDIELALRRQMRGAMATEDLRLQAHLQLALDLTAAKEETEDVNKRINLQEQAHADFAAAMKKIKEDELKVQRGLQASLEDRQYKLGLITEQEYIRLQIERERRKLEEGGASDEMIEKTLAVYRQQLDPDFFTSINKELAEMRRNFEKLVDPANQVIGAANAIGDAFGNSFKQVITGQASAREALANFFQSVANHFADMASQIIAEAIKMQAVKFISQIVAAFVPSGGGGGGGLASNLDSQSLFSTDLGLPSMGSLPSGFKFAEGGYVQGGFKAFNQGGVVSQPTLGMVGEGGEPEYIIPQSKMRESMARYSRGVRGPGVIPGNGVASMSEGSGVGVASPIDVRFSVERINNVDYVTADQFQQGLQQAAAQGAQRGEQQTLRRLQMSSSTRRRIGV